MPAFPKQNPTETDPVASPAVSAHAALTTSAHGGIVASDDARLTNARTPTAHKTTHATGQSDAIAPSDIGAATAAAAAAAQSTADGAVVLADSIVAGVVPGTASRIHIEAEGARSIVTNPVVPALTENTPAARILVEHPGSNSVPAGHFILTPYEYGMGFTYEQVVQWTCAQFAVCAIPGSQANICVADERDNGATWLTSHLNTTGFANYWTGETYGELWTERWDGTAHGSLRLRVHDTPRTVTDAVLNGTTTVTSATANWTNADLGRRIQCGNGPGWIDPGAYIASIVNGTTVTISSAAGASGSGRTITIGRETVEFRTGTTQQPDGSGNGTLRLAVGRIGPSGEPGLQFGALEDTNLYRGAAGNLYTDGHFTLSAALHVGTGAGFWGHSPPGSQPAAPTTLADVIAIIRGCGLSA